MEDLYYFHIGGMDCFVRTLFFADNIIGKSNYNSFRKERYSSLDSSRGKDFEDENLLLEGLPKLLKNSANLDNEVVNKNYLNRFT